MTTELEQRFYDTFGVEPYFQYLLVDIKARKKKEHLFDKTELIEFCTTHKDFILLKVVKRYPNITAEKLLEMICIYNNNVYENEKITPANINTLKEDVLHWFITDFVENDKVKHQIQQLFNVDDTHKSTMLNIITDDEY